MLVNRAGTASLIRSDKLGEVLTLVNEVEWRFPDRTAVQLHLPHYYISDEMGYMSQGTAFAGTGGLRALRTSRGVFPPRGSEILVKLRGFRCAVS